MDALHFDHLSFAYGSGRFSLSDISVRIPTGAFAAILGPNGAGKTTLFCIACGMLAPSGGAVRVLDRDVAEYDRRSLARAVAYVGQHPPPAIAMRVEEYILLGRIPYARGLAFTSREDARHVEDAMAVTRCAGLRAASLNELSGGELQRVLVARALAQDPQVLLLDEPNSHLDVSHQVQLFSALRAWQERSGRTVIASTHDLNLAAMYAHMTIFLAGGRVAAAGAPHNVMDEALIARVYGIRAEIVPGYYGASPAVHIRPQ